MTLIEIVEASSARLQEAGVCFGHGTYNAFDEAVWLVLWRLGLPLDELDGVAARPLSEEDVGRVQALVDERIHSRKPAAYLTREAWLQGVPFYIDERAIVPRSLIAEVLAEGLIDAWLGGEPGGAPNTVLDLCTGNGSLAVLAALAWPQAHVDAADLSADALAVARINLDQHELGTRITLHLGDGLAAVGVHRYDLILCNPPYVNAQSMAALPPEFLAEPGMALHGGSDGMDFIRGLLASAADHLNEGGALVLEVGHERENFDAAFPQLDAIWLPTSGGDDQVLLLTRSALLGL